MNVKNGVEYIRNGDLILAIVLRSSFREEGIHFFSPNEFSQQLGYMNRPRGYVIQPHVHNPVGRNVSYTKEVIIVKTGLVRVDFYDESKTYISSRLLKPGDLVLLAYGGHGFEMIEDAEIIEVKQGPYAGELDKTRFEPIHSASLNVKGEI